MENPSLSRWPASTSHHSALEARCDLAEVAEAFDPSLIRLQRPGEKFNEESSGKRGQWADAFRLIFPSITPGISGTRNEISHIGAQAKYHVSDRFDSKATARRTGPSFVGVRVCVCI
jgi:hypothetical protein